MEAAGLALAILPLLINQLDNYVQGLQTVKGFRAKRYRQQLDSYFSNIGTQHVIFSNTLERALDGVVEYQDGIDELINNPSGEAWKQPELVKRMEKKLERNYFPFNKTMTELAALLQDLSRRLKFEKMSSAEKTWEDASTLEREVRKFRDIFSKSIYVDILDRISAANAILDTLVKQSESSPTTSYKLEAESEIIQSSFGVRESLQELVTASACFLKGQPDEGFLFSQLDRLRVAVILSCGVFQFHGSWLRHDWRSRDIMFCPQNKDETGYFYISWNLEDNTDCLNVFDCQNAPTLIRNLVLFPLGLVLVELSLCQSLESMREHDDTDHNQAHANLKTATRLLPKVEQRSGPEYAEVVDRCLSWHDRKETSLDSEKLQEEVFQLIISPLVKNLKSFEEYLEVDEV
ncbi:hypothetical protein N8T08_010688 [Aspergillus melleus]|uniref:Uncharacterized protein n=1 Tax=Aspergillus melleus TaxID=138277 RepID=A0ACC3BBV2_9EURO|nr:hypothetical protein N8T08_010688 [Aspergillus melleus]